MTDANQLISQNKVVALIGLTSSPATLAIKPISQKQGLPLMALAAANTITDQAPIDWIGGYRPRTRWPWPGRLPTFPRT